MRLITTVLIISLFSSCLAATGLCLAAESQPIKRHKLTIGKLRQEMKSQSIKIEQNEQKQSSLLNELNTIDDKIAEQQEKVLQIQDKIIEQKKIIASKTAEIEAINAEKMALQAHLEKRLHAYYLMGKNGILHIAFSRESIPELLIFNDSFKYLVTYDHAIFEAYRQRKESIIHAKKAHELEKSVQENFLQRAEEEKKTLLYISEQKNHLLKRAKTEKSLYELALKEMKLSETELTDQIASLKKKEEKKAKGFLLNKGKLTAPVDGTLLSTFGQSDKDVSQSKGITISIQDGAQVHAIFRGRVIFTGYMRGYGRTVIIDHGYNYFTVTSRLEQIIVEKGDKVEQDQIIATSGDIATLFGKGLYFEIRQGSVAQDPLEWLRPNAFSQEQDPGK